MLPLYAHGLTTGEISAHFASIYGASVSKETVSRITDTVVEEMTEWANRPLDGVYAEVFIDAIMVKVRDGQVAKPAHLRRHRGQPGRRQGRPRPVGRHRSRRREVLDVLTDLKNRGITDVFFLVCDGLKGLPKVVGNVWPLTTVQSCINHLIRNTLRVASRKDWDALRRDVKPIYTAVSADAAAAALDDVEQKWGKRYPAIIRLWRSAWAEFISFLDYDVEIRKVLCSTNAIECAERPVPASCPPPEGTSRPNKQR